jgi:hypothetical protein
MANAGDTLSTILRRALGIFAVFALLPLVVVTLVNYVVDPFQYFRVVHPAQFSNGMQRFQAPGIVRNYDFDTIIAGNSVVANLRNSIFDRAEFAVKPKTMNLSFWGSTIREDAYVVALALNTRPIKTVYWSIARQALAEFRYADFPKCMYGGVYRFIPPYCYLLNSNVFWESYVTVSHSNDSTASWIREIDQWKTFGPLKIDPHAEACRLQGLVKRDDIDRLTRLAKDDLGPTNGLEVERYRAVVLPIVRANPGVRFVFLFSPLHLGEFWRKAVYGSLKVERALTDLFLGEPNVEIHDMVGLIYITHDLSHYRDAYHYDSEGSRQVVAALASGQLKINSIAQHEKMQREEIEAGAALMHAYYQERCP